MHVPLARDRIQMSARKLQATLVELRHALAAERRRSDEARVVHHAQMLRNGLTRDRQAVGELP
jgi:hypothetical protein